MTAEQARKSPAKGRGGLTWFTPGRFALLLGVLFFACFPQIILGLETFAYGDFGQFAYPVAFYHREAFWRGEWPLWNPLNSCGIPFLAQWNTLTLYPPSLFYLLFPLPWSFNVFCLGHLFLGGLGMYFLARRWTGHPLASALAGTVFAFNGLTWYGIMWPHLDAALGWMPWVILAIERACQEGGRNLVFASLAGGVQMLSGGAEVIIQTWFVAGVSCAFRIHNHNQDGSGKPVASHIWAFARFFAVVVLVAGLAAVQLAPFIDLLSHSQRSSQYGSSAVPGLEAMPLTGWANYLVPLFHCFRNPEGVFLQLSQTWTGSYYLGTGILALALFAAWGVRHRRVWLLAGLTLFALLLALGDRGLVYGWTRAVLPFISIMRFPIKFVMLTTFSIPLLAAFGLARLLEIPAEEWPREWRRAKYVGGGLLVLTIGLAFAAWRFPAMKDEASVVATNALSRALFLVLFLCWVVLLRRSLRLGWDVHPSDSVGRAKTSTLLQAALIVLLWSNVFTHVPNPSPTAPSRVLAPDRVRRHFGWARLLEPGTSRAMVSPDAFWKVLTRGSENPELDIDARRLALVLNYNLLDHAAKFDGFYSSDVSEYLDIFKQLYFTTNQAPGLRDFLGVSEVSNPTNSVDWVQRDSFLPLVTIGQEPCFAAQPETLAAILDPNFAPRQTVFLPPEAREAIRATRSPDARIVSTRFSSSLLEVETQNDAPAMVVVSQTFYHPWQVSMDGTPLPLWRANYAFQAFEVPAGKHNVRLEYQDKAFLWGGVVSAVSGVICVAIWLLTRRKEAPVSASSSQTA